MTKLNLPTCLVVGLIVTTAMNARADEAKITWYDVSCRYMLVQLNEGFGLYEWRSGAEPKANDAITGDIAGGPEVEATLKSSGEKMSLTHWGDAPKSETLLRVAPRGCLNKPRKK
jgi:hypothetical protein